MPVSTAGHSPAPADRRPGKIVCIGRNYREHAKELGNEVPTEPLFFLKPPSSIITEGEAIMLPEQSEKVEFEGEIGILIGLPLTRASQSEAEQAVAGVLAVNDVTARDLQRKDSQWTRAKGFDTFCPLGPVSTGRHDLGKLTVVTRVNGVERQRASSAEMVFSIGMLLSYVSHVMTLEPGDIVATGTPSGVGPLEPGDVVEVEVVGVSKVSNPVEARG
jgi:2-keto-4-pentenoate hydratase/2-oxohepta-3-ene-1,7-dioic acid hydratase in catechol pathway